MSTRIFIYGSCVSRDSVSFWEQFDLELNGYVARQSVISAAHPSSLEVFDLDGLRPPFLGRMVYGDVTSDLEMQLAERVLDCEVILWDIADERNGVWKIPESSNGGFVTRLATYRERYSGVSELGRGILFGEREHLDLWRHAVDGLLKFLETVDARSKLIINAVPWAERFESGEPTTPGSHRGAEWFNETSLPYYEHFESCGVAVSRPSAERVIADSNHRWGPAPYHYVSDTYIASIESVSSYIRGRA